MPGKKSHEGAPRPKTKVELGTTTDIEAAELLQKTLIPRNASEIDGDMLDIDTLEANGIIPKHKIKIDDTRTWFSSDPYDIGGGRTATMVFVKKGDKVVARSFWCDDADKMWKLLSAYKDGKPIEDISVKLPATLQEAWSEMTADAKNIKTVKDADLIFLGTAINLDGKTTDTTKKADVAPTVEKTKPTKPTVETKEIGDERANLLKTVFEGVKILKNIFDKLDKKTNSDKASRLKWVMRAVNAARLEVMDEAESKNADDGKFEVCEYEGSTNCQREGIPVDDLLEELRGARQDILDELEAKHDAMKKAVKKTDDDTDLEAGIEEEKERATQKIAEIIRLIDSNATKSAPDKKWEKWRKEREALLVHKDERHTDDEKKDWAMAEAALQKRRELILPAKKEEVVEEPVEEIQEPDEEPLPSVTPIVEPEPIAPEPEPEPEIVSPIKHRGHFIDISPVVRRMAWSQAEEKTNAYIRGLDPNNAQVAPAGPKRGFFSRLAHGVKDAVLHPIDTAKWVGRQMRTAVFIRPGEDLYMKKFYEEALAEITNNKNLLAEIETNLITSSKGKEITGEQEDKNYQILNNIIENFSEDVAAESEKGDKIVDDDEVNGELARLFYEYAIGEITNRKDFDQLVEERLLPIIQRKNYTFSKTKPDESEQKLFAHNFFELAKNYKKQIEDFTAEIGEESSEADREAIIGHVQGMMNLDIELGLKERDVRETKPKFVRNWMDKLMDKSRNMSILGKALTTPMMMAGASAFAVSTLIAKGAASWSMKLMLAAPGVGAIMGGILGAKRRGKELLSDRGLEMRRAALGQEARGDNAKEMRQFTYEKMRTEDVVAVLEDIANKPTDELTGEDQEMVAKILGALNVETEFNTDMFAASAEEGKNLNTRIRSITQIKILLKQIRETHGLSEDTLAEEIRTASDGFEQHIETTDGRFKGWRREKMGLSAVKGALIGFAAGAVGECLFTTFACHGFGDSWIGKMAECLKTDGKGYEHTFQTALFSSNHTEVAAGGGLVLGENTDGTVVLFDKEGNTILDDIRLNPHGGLDQHALEILKEKGFKIAESEHLHSGATGLDVADNAPTTFETMPIPGFKNNITLPTGWKVMPTSIPLEMSILDGKGIPVGSFELNLDGSGTIRPDSIKLFNEAGFDVSTTTHQVLAGGREAIENELQKSGGMYSTFHDRVWHTNVDPTSANTTDNIYDGKELRGWLDNRPNEYSFNFKHGIEDMVQKGKVNWDGSIDDKYAVMAAAIKGRDFSQFNIRFYLSPEDFKAGNAISVALDPTTGEMVVEKGSNLATLLLDEKGASRLTWEVAFNGPDGKAHILATMLGKGGPTPPVQTEVTDYIFRPRDITVDRVVIDTPDVNPAFIPIVPNRREAMEAGDYPEPPLSPVPTEEETHPTHMKKGGRPPAPSETAAAVALAAASSLASEAITTKTTPDRPPSGGSGGAAAVAEAKMMPFNEFFEIKGQLNTDISTAVANYMPKLNKGAQRELTTALSALAIEKITHDHWDPQFTKDFVAKILAWIAANRTPLSGGDRDKMSAEIIKSFAPTAAASEIDKVVIEKREFVKDILNKIPQPTKIKRSAREKMEKSSKA